jgi:hypothetical protein
VRFKRPSERAMPGTHEASKSSLRLAGNIELHAYSLGRCAEASSDELAARVFAVSSATPPFERLPNSVAQDLHETPRVLKAIEDDWANLASPNVRAAEALSAHLLERMRAPRSARSESLDLVLVGIEVSLSSSRRTCAPSSRTCTCAPSPPTR